ncbi:Os06g0290701 [Oryza sativa Japonica Group]|uniref:Os06g0290701 protein n=1 Tax=Oryza sativa subsp. japonica TaxID=39947 RepID=A0A0P0WVQ4_ORYSJ|nr:Os06g0290701 [Oryza sativa Japonica Group]
MVTDEMNSTWHWRRRSLAMGFTWDTSVTSVTTAVARGATPAMAGARRCMERRRASHRSRNGSAPGNSEASSGSRLKSTRRMLGKSWKRRAKWSASAADTVGRTVTTEMSTSWEDSAPMKRKNGRRWPMPALGMKTTCGRSRRRASGSPELSTVGGAMADRSSTCLLKRT